jgi:diguanylate cyclase (GGDEF)-like protein
MTLGLYPQEESNALDTARRSPAGVIPDAKWYQGAPKALATGVGEGLESIRQTAETGITEAEASMLGTFQQIAGSSGMPPQTMMAGKLLATDPDEMRHERAVAAKKALDYYKPNPAVVGSAGQLLHGVAAGVTPFLVGSMVGTPLVGAATVGVTQGSNTRSELMAQGVDEHTANVLGLANAGIGYFSAALPGGVGKIVAQHIASGAAIQELAGLTNRTMMHTALDAAGYRDMANQYRPLDLQAMISDAIIGSAFGGVHSVFAPSVVDAAHTINDAHQLESSGPGVPIDQVARERHVSQVENSVRALMDDAPVMDKTIPDTVPNPAQNAQRGAAISESAKAEAESLGEALGPSDEAIGQPGRRAEDIETARAGELRQKLLESGLTDDEKVELLALYEKDRLAAKVGGRRLAGVQNLTAYTEMLQRGEQKPVQGFADMDMMKAVNDAMGHETGDEAIHAVGHALTKQFGEGNVFLRSGDEFHVQAKDQATFDTAMSAAEQHLANHTLRKEDASGTLIAEKRGIGISHGSGPTIEHAESAQYAHKESRRLAGLRSGRDDTGAVDQVGRTPPRQDQGRTPARAGADRNVSVKTPAEALSRLTRALQTLRESNGKDEAAHNEARGLVRAAQDKGWDTQALGKQAAARAGEGADRALKDAVQNEHPLPDTEGLDPATREAVDQANRILETRGDIPVERNEQGETTRTAREALQQAMDEAKVSQQTGVLHQIAAACFGRA